MKKKQENEKNNKGNLSIAFGLKVSAICAQLTRSYDAYEQTYSLRCLSMHMILFYILFGEKERKKISNKVLEKTTTADGHF